MARLYCIVGTNTQTYFGAQLFAVPFCGLFTERNVKHMTAISRQGDLTHGPIARLLIAYSIPLLLGNLLQQLYTMADSIIVGNWVGKEALAAVGATATIVQTLVGFFVGIGVGVSVVVSQYYGAKDILNLRRAIHTTILLTLVMGIVCTFLGIALTPAMLWLMDTPADVYDLAYEYLTIYFAGVAGLIFYNMLSGILRAMGDSKRPLYFLIFSCFLNIGLDALFVIVFHWGVAGAAWATTFSQVISALAIFVLMCRTKEDWKINFHQLKVDWPITRRIFVIGLPTAINSSVISLSNVAVTAFINAFGSNCMAGWSAYVRIHNLIFLPMQSLSMAATTFVGQNYGARKADRIRRGNKVALALSCGCAVVLGAFIMLLAKPAVLLFNSDPDVLYYGCLFLWVQTPMMILGAITDTLAGTLRGLGDSKFPAFAMVTSYVVFRQIYLRVLTPFTDSIMVPAFAYPVGWILCTIIMCVYFPVKMRHLLANIQPHETAGAQ